jgi:proteasome accessory factor C
VEVVIEDDRLWVHFARSFSRPLRLTPEEGLALLASAAGVLARPGTDPAGPLAVGLRKLADTLGIDPEQAMDVELGRVSPAVLDVLQGAARDHRQVEIDYYGYGRDTRTVRVIDPLRVYSERGQWYALAWCHHAGGERCFRVDRIRHAELLATSFEPRAPTTTGAYEADPDDPRITLDLASSARWVVEQYPAESVEAREDGTTRVTLAVSALPWLERVLLRLGPAASLVAVTPGLPADPGGAAAARVLARYRGQPAAR